MNFNLSELQSLFKCIKEIINDIEREEYKNKRFKLYLANGECINLAISEKYIASLLGINAIYLSSLFNNSNSFDSLKELINNPDKIYELVNQKIISYDNLFSKSILLRIALFRENLSLNIHDTQFVCKCDNERSYTNDGNFKKYDYVIVKKLPNDKYGLLYLVKNSEFCNPINSEIYDDYDSLSIVLQELVRAQEITLLNSIKSFNRLQESSAKSYELSLEDKKLKIEKLKLYKNEFNCYIDLTDDLEKTINKLKIKIENIDSIEICSNNIAKFINNCSVIETNYSIEPELLPIVQAFNNFLYSQNLAGISEDSTRNSEIIKVLINFKSKLEALEDANKNLEDENHDLSAKNEELIETQDKIYQLLKGKTAEK